MSEQKRKLSKLCLAGFILSVLSPVVLVLTLCFSWYMDYRVYALMFALVGLFPLIGLVLSVIGLITAKIKRRKGKGFGIAGIALPNLYAAFIVLMVVLMLVGQSSTIRTEKESDLNSMWGVGTPVNTEYDVSRYRIYEGYDIDSSDISVSEEELIKFAESKLEIISKESDMVVKGKYKGNDFLIIRRDRFNDWQKEDRLGSINYSDKGYASLTYSVTWEFAASGIYTLDVYKDPSDRFIIITNCSDHKVISDLLG